MLPGIGKPAGHALKGHNEPSAVLLHGMEKSHNMLVKELGLVSQALQLEGSKWNPLKQVNEIHVRLKKFLHSHNGFNRDGFQVMLVLFCVCVAPD